MPGTWFIMQKSKFHFWLFLVAFYAAWILRATWFYSQVDLSIPDNAWRLVFSNGMKFLLWVLPAAAYVLWHDRQSPLVTMKINSRLDRQGLFVGFGVSLAYFAGVIIFEYFTSHRTLAPLLRAAPSTILSTLTSTFFSPISEELFFRGFVLPKLNESMRFWLANLIQAVLFTAIHWPNWIWVSGFQWSLIATSASIFLLGMFLGWLTRRTDSIWPVVTMHIVNNFLAAFLG
jgi:uncharacterized protein